MALSPLEIYGDSTVAPGYTTLPGGKTVLSTSLTPGDMTSGGSGTSANNLASAVDQSNLAAAPYMTQLSQLINSLNQTAQQTANMSRIPGEAGLEQQSSDSIAAELAGNLNPGTVSTIEDQMAQMYGGRGFGVDNASTSAAAMRAMGLTAEGQVQAGQANLSSATARNPSAPIYGAQGLLVSPNEYLAAQQAAAKAAGAGSGGSGGVRTTGGGGGATTANPTQAVRNFGGGGSYPTTTANTPAPNTTGTGTSPYYPGGSSPFGLIDAGNGNYLDMFDSSGLYGTVMPSYGSTPDYSNPSSYLDYVPGAPTIDNYSNFPTSQSYYSYDPSSWTTADYGAGVGNNLSGAGAQFGMDTSLDPNYNWIPNDSGSNLTWEDYYGYEGE